MFELKSNFEYLRTSLGKLNIAQIVIAIIALGVIAGYHTCDICRPSMRHGAMFLLAVCCIGVIVAILLMLLSLLFQNLATELTSGLFGFFVQLVLAILWLASAAAMFATLTKKPDDDVATAVSMIPKVTDLPNIGDFKFTIPSIDIDLAPRKAMPDFIIHPDDVAGTVVGIGMTTYFTYLLVTGIFGLLCGILHVVSVIIVLKQRKTQV